MVDIPYYLSHYGYLALFIGCLLEGETILILAGLAAHQGLMSYPLVVGVAFVGGLLGDQFLFYLGRVYGNRILDKFPSLAQKAETAKNLITKYQSFLIIIVRFMYGFRIIGPITIGMSNVSSKRFFIFNMIGALLWALLVSGAGYLFGSTVEWFLLDFKHHKLLLVSSIIFILLIITLLRLYKYKKYLKD